MKFVPGAEIPEEYGRYNLLDIFSKDAVKRKFSSSSYNALKFKVYQAGEYGFPYLSKAYKYGLSLSELDNLENGNSEL
tara:strand:+ start:208 stop:441 length:234 start_codon:yes stop_codon:yes gene_type:complete